MYDRYYKYRITVTDLLIGLSLVEAENAMIAQSEQY